MNHASIRLLLACGFRDNFFLFWCVWIGEFLVIQLKPETSHENDTPALQHITA